MVNSNLYSNAVKSLWNGKCTITVIKNVTDEATGRTAAKENVLYSDERCRISYGNADVVQSTENAQQAVQRITLFIGVNVLIPDGSKITVTQNGVTGIYVKSGKPAVYSNHQEIPLELKREWA